MSFASLNKEELSKLLSGRDSMAHRENHEVMQKYLRLVFLISY
jgi:hypothetical protein